MCGIAALLCRQPHNLALDTIQKLTRLVTHRGPDGEGIEYFLSTPEGLRNQPNPEISADWTCALGHRRLSILDLSSAGRQPMSRGRHLWISYNGEIFNYLEVRKELEQCGHTFRSSSDTEVVLAAYEQWGVSCFERFSGMWGLILLDGNQNQAILSRDRLGIKPLFVAKTPTCWAVASEIKQLLAVPGVPREPNTEHLVRYLLYGEDGSEDTFFSGINNIPAGHYQIIDLQTLEARNPERYWFPERVQSRPLSRNDAASIFSDIFQRAVLQHMRSDVPVGCALSGGLDSSSIAALMHQQAPGLNLHTFTASFPGHVSDERHFAQQLLDTISATPHFVTPTASRFLEDFDTFIEHHDEPVGSFSQYAGYCVARSTHKAGIPVTLNGQGGDEVFSAYWQCYFAHFLNLAQEQKIMRLGSDFLATLLPRGNPHIVRQIPLMARRYWSRRHAVPLLRTVDGSRPNAQSVRVLQLPRSKRRVWEITQLTLPRLLKWDDRNFMAFSVEGRYPFLDHRVIETCLTFDDETLYWRGWTKEPLRHGLRRVLPASIARRPTKVGFEVPMAHWIQGTLLSAMRAQLGDPGVIGDLVRLDSIEALFDRVEGGDRRRETLETVFRVYNTMRWSHLRLS